MKFCLFLLLFVTPLLSQAQTDTGSEATVASPSFDPKNPDCKCLGSKTAGRWTENDGESKDKVAMVLNPAVPLPPLDEDSKTNH